MESKKRNSGKQGVQWWLTRAGRGGNEEMLVKGHTFLIIRLISSDFPGDSAVKRPPATARDPGLIPGPGG